MKTLYIRTEANITTATGHMTRCMAIAERARSINIETVFIVAEDGSKQLPMSAGFKVIVLGSVWNDFDNEIPVMTRLIEDLDIRCLLIDSYFVSKKYVNALNSITKVAYIDDLHEGIWPVSIIIDYAIYHDLFDYAAEYPEADRLLGCSYAPVRPEYMGVHPADIKEKPKNALVVTGGSDENHFMLGLVNCISKRKEWADIHFKFITGRFNRDFESIKEVADATDNVEVITSLPTLKDELLRTDILITAGGTTLYEMAVCAVPGIAVRIASNQHMNVDGFVRHGLVLDGGDVEADFSYDDFLATLNRLITDYALRKELTSKMKNFVDVNGALRIAEALGKYL